MVIGLAFFAAIPLALMIAQFLLRQPGRWWLLLVCGPLAALFLFLALGAALLVTIVDASGVRPGGSRSPLIPWEEVGSFAAIKREGTISPMWDVTLIRAGSQRPVSLPGTPSDDQGAHRSTDDLNKILSVIRARCQDGPVFPLE